MATINDIQFFQLKKVRAKTFAKKIRFYLKPRTNGMEQWEEKQKHIKEYADKINKKLVNY